MSTERELVTVCAICLLVDGSQSDAHTPTCPH